ncbi:hypothetical protein [Streptosporangium sp. 'caverna']|uniref:hypothetical protein n=1 Tax=Streptosporangium sp. 'caverna' TaxID=2202249 RepID=UPI0013A6B721|nr:hypothetical protein [Streptosporangium sp. 'caverna']
MEYRRTKGFTLFATCRELNEPAFPGNRPVVHGHTGFTPRYDRNDRRPHRAHVQLDGRRDLSQLVGPGPVSA